MRQNNALHTTPATRPERTPIATVRCTDIRAPADRPGDAGAKAVVVGGSATTAARADDPLTLPTS